MSNIVPARKRYRPGLRIRSRSPNRGLRHPARRFWAADSTSTWRRSTDAGHGNEIAVYCSSGTWPPASRNVAKVLDPAASVSVYVNRVGGFGKQPDADLRRHGTVARQAHRVQLVFNRNTDVTIMSRYRRPLPGPVLGELRTQNGTIRKWKLSSTRTAATRTTSRFVQRLRHSSTPTGATSSTRSASIDCRQPADEHAMRSFRTIR